MTFLNMIRRAGVWAFLLFVGTAGPVRAGIHDRLMWTDSAVAAPDRHVAFRGTFSLDADTTVDLQLSGASWYVVWLDGAYYTEGPDRYAAKYPEYQTRRVRLAAGEHTLAVQVQHEGVATRILREIQPFLYVRASVGDREVPVRWRCLPLEGYASQVRRVNPQLGWVEWVDTRRLPEGWQQASFDDSSWAEPVSVRRPLGEFAPSRIAPVRSLDVTPRLIGKGVLAEVFGYPGDNPGASFFLRDLDDSRYPAQGVWRRYDLGRVRLSRPCLRMDLPEGAVVEIAFSEFLSGGRVAPWITLSAGDSYNLCRFVARGGEQAFFPLVPKGGRFVEVHVIAPPDSVRFLEERFVERSYYDRPEGRFACGDTLLERIWNTGIETYKACSEDALIDNPTRERGQWLGDVGIVGMEIGAAGFSDIAIVRRGLVQSAQCADSAGLVAGLCPGGESYMASYALQWVPACLSYVRLTGDRTLLGELYEAAERNVAAFDRYMTDEGISGECPYWNFIDWGYVPNDGPCDMALNLHYMIAVQSMTRWSSELRLDDREAYYREKADRFRRILDRYYAACGFDWDKVGYHRTVLGLRAGLVPDDRRAEAVAFIKRHILRCFPNDPTAPRLSDPAANNPRLITPYFAHYAFPVLFESGEADFVLDQYRACWGWALGEGRTTWVEVFDTRWTHCHQWAGAPTWQLTRYVLGLHPRFDRRTNSFDLKLLPGSLGQAEGDVPLPSGERIAVRWQAEGDRIRYTVSAPSEAIEIVTERGERIRVKPFATRTVCLKASQK
ncbi:MAG: hypothetical protein KH248_01010 [Alistipes indistinctus]|uniref:alpha-L-rhamnosidase-related protein n=1 Tax=Alistipes ihumii TaxID=1470347 RepID=UPI003AB2457B|nr:hypothetical protein [Alistipes indistinctus]